MTGTSVLLFISGNFQRNHTPQSKIWAGMNGIKSTIIILCILICSSAWVAPKKVEDCYAVPSKDRRACDDDIWGTHAFDKVTGTCVPCCNCFGSNSFKTKQECESFCK
ncbi:hypothetical protein Y032_0036g3183 [Ancylostoma ceylanicum]|nr:hypothetical protein Y032_0036g3183 [Ancylostoma ceylanicum]